MRFLIVVKPHLLRERQAVKVISVLDPSTPDQTLSVSDAVDAVAGAHSTPLLHATEKSADFGEQLGLSDTSGTVQNRHLIVVNNSGNATASNTSGRRRDHKEQIAIHRRVNTYLDRLVEASDTPPTVIAIEAPFSVIRAAGTWYMVDGCDEECFNNMVETSSKFRRALVELRRVLAELEASGGAEGGHPRGGSMRNRVEQRKSEVKNVWLYSVVDDRYDLVFLAEPSSSSSGRRGSGQGTEKRERGRKGRDRGSNR